MNLSRKPRTRRGARLLAIHLRCLDPEVIHARERLDVALGAELARKLVFALGGNPLQRRAA